MSNQLSDPPPTPYSRFVFREGRFVGEFEQMYRESPVVPWHQDRAAEAWPTGVLLTMLAPHAPFETALDVGCGLGYCTAKLAALCSTVRGVDLSPTAIERARELFPMLILDVWDVRQATPSTMAPVDLLVIKELLWYVMLQLDDVLERLDRLIRPGGWLMVGQSFPRLDTPFYGKERLPDPPALLRLLSRAYAPEASVVLMEHSRPDNGPMLLALMRKAG